MTRSSETGLKPPAFSALALAFASFGDAFLYPFLPLNFHAVGVPLFWVGALLAVNRFVRIISNALIVHAFARYGLRCMMILATVLAVTSTLGYGLATGLTAWFIFRVMWGLAFSAMRIGTIGYALQQQRKGFALGVSKSLQETGPMMALFIAPFLLDYFQPRAIFCILSILSLPAFYFAFALPKGDDKTQAVEGKRLIQWPSTMNTITLVSAILIDGIIVVVLGVLFIQYRENMSIVTATTLAAFYLGYRRICLVTLSPAGGLIADRIGLDTVFNISMVLVVSGLIVILCGWIATGAVIVFTFYSINAAVTPGSAARGNPHSLAAVAENATWRDIGAAVGTLIGGFLVTTRHIDTVLTIAIAALVIFLFVHLRYFRRSMALSYLSR